ncbi:MAG: PadR family transcriptional regulator, partial [Candidatus Nanohaloarchaea archaeon]
MRTSGPPKGVVTYLVLELLASGPRYGYEIQSEIADLSGGHWEPSLRCSILKRGPCIFRHVF